MTQTFSEYMAQFLEDINAKKVVEVGSDPQFRLASKLAPYCKTFYSVNFQEEGKWWAVQDSNLWPFD